MKFAIALMTLALSMSAHAAFLGKCEGLDSVGNLVGQTKSFENGAVKVAYISTEEPAASPDHILVFVYGEEMDLQCFSVNQSAQGDGFGFVHMDKLTSSYDSSLGLLLTLPVDEWTGVDGKYNTRLVKMRVNQQRVNAKLLLEP